MSSGKKQAIAYVHMRGESRWKEPFCICGYYDTPFLEYD